ncbi:MAG: hypothetical protein ACE5G2_06625 [Candidatus Krumholzibacteriia bacterium]
MRRSTSGFISLFPEYNLRANGLQVGGLALGTGAVAARWMWPHAGTEGEIP